MTYGYFTRRKNNSKQIRPRTENKCKKQISSDLYSTYMDLTKEDRHVHEFTAFAGVSMAINKIDPLMIILKIRQQIHPESQPATHLFHTVSFMELECRSSSFSYLYSELFIGNEGMVARFFGSK